MPTMPTRGELAAERAQLRELIARNTGAHRTFLALVTPLALVNALTAAWDRDPKSGIAAIVIAIIIMGEELLHARMQRSAQRTLAAIDELEALLRADGDAAR